MAMTKKEAAEVERVKNELRLKGALRATSEVKPDVPFPECCYSDKEGLSKGFMFCGERSNEARIEPACSGSVHHAVGRNDRTTTQQPINLYSTRLLALKALRYAVEQDCCSRLARIDEMIEKELSS